MRWIQKLFELKPLDPDNRHFCGNQDNSATRFDGHRWGDPRTNSQTTIKADMNQVNDSHGVFRCSGLERNYVSSYLPRFLRHVLDIENNGEDNCQKRANNRYPNY